MEGRDIGVMIKILSETINQQMNASFKDLNLTMQQMQILRFLRKREGQMDTSQKDIQEYMRLSHPTVVNMLHLLQNKGFIRTEVSPKDRRIRLVTLTGQEKRVVEEVSHCRNQMEALLVQGFSAEEQADLRRYLVQMYHNITGTLPSSACINQTETRR